MQRESKAIQLSFVLRNQEESSPIRKEWNECDALGLQVVNEHLHLSGLPSVPFWSCDLSLQTSVSLTEKHRLNRAASMAQMR